MKANMADAAYVVDRARTTTWRFDMVYVPAGVVVPLLHRYLSASRLPYAERASTLQVLRACSGHLQFCRSQSSACKLSEPLSHVLCRLHWHSMDCITCHVPALTACIALSQTACLQALAQARMEEAAFDASRLVDFSERPVFEGPATQLTPLVGTL